VTLQDRGEIPAAAGTRLPSNDVQPSRGGLVGRYPVTVAALGVLLVTAVATDSLAWGPSQSLLNSIGAGTRQPLWTVLTAGFWCAHLPSYLATVLGILAFLAPAERCVGSRRVAVGLVVGQVTSVSAGLLLIRIVAGTGYGWADELSTMVVVGVFPGLLAVAGLHTAQMPALWRRRVRLTLSIALLALILYSGTAADVLRLSGWILGLVAGALLRRPRSRLRAPRPSRREERALVALVLAVTALGPLVAALSRTPDGPWAVVAHLFVSDRPAPGLLRAVCGTSGDPVDCAVLQSRAGLTGNGTALSSVLPVLLQLGLAEGLRRGRRAAWAAAVLLQLALATVGGAVVLTVLGSPADALPMLALDPEKLSTVSILAPLAAPLTVLLLLLTTRTRFGVRAAPGSARRWLAAAAAGLGVVAGLYVLVGSLLSSQFAGGPSVWGLLADLPVRMLPPGYLGEVLAPLVPLDDGARVLTGWAGVAAWTVLLVITVRLVRPVAPAGDAVRARRLVERYGDGPLSFMATWVGNRYWFSAAGTTVVAYRVIGGIALTTGDPIGPPESRLDAVDEFTRWCEEHGWTACWYSVSDRFAEELSGTGLQRLQVASETVLPLGSLAFTGRRWQDVRTATNRAAREGIRAEWVTWSQSSSALRAQLTELSEEWLSTKGLPEMGFTLGGLDELADDAVRTLVAVGPGGRVLALTSWLPAYQESRPIGWTLDVMRRSGDAGSGVVEFLIATAALTFQADGAAWMSLSGAPLALPAGTADEGRLARLLELAGRTMEPVYGFRSLLAFKAKFQPRYQPLWLLYPSAVALPRIARAVSGAYLPHLSLAQSIRLVGALIGRRRTDVRRPSSAATPVGTGQARELAGSL
jgi:phosphatidylglycerol lysyltransferase